MLPALKTTVVAAHPVSACPKCGIVAANTKAACAKCGIVAATMASVCLKCGIIDKTGKASCCGRGGSWFKECGSAGNAKVDHTWRQGRMACMGVSRSGLVMNGLSIVIEEKSLSVALVSQGCGSISGITVWTIFFVARL